jgi:putative nucleotidyltransferase with HDIG domain
LLGDIEGLARRGFADAAHVSRGVSSSITVLQDIFGSVCLGVPPQSEIIDRAGLAVMSDIASLGLAPWIESVRKHHSQTYQHCLLVAGTAVAFAQQLGFSKADQQKLSFAALLHDVGKASIPITILEKPGPLDASELAVMRQHPSFGFETLRAAHDIPAEMMDMVLHHHEYLDGSGYPDGLRGCQIPDLVRIMTISDIFGALMERRAYKAPLTAEAAYQIMTEMNGKLDPDLLREFSAVAHLQRVH